MSVLLLAMLAVPFASAAVVLLIGHRSAGAGKGIAVGGEALALVLACVVAGWHLGNIKSRNAVEERTNHQRFAATSPSRSRRR